MSATPGIEVRLRVHTATLPPSAEIVVHAQDADHEQTAPLRDRLMVPEVREQVRVTCRGEGLWCPEVQPVSGVARLPVFGTMLVEAQLAGPGADSGLTEGTVQGIVKGGAEGETIEFRETLTVVDGEVSFAAPSADLDLRFAFPGSAPLYRWGVGPSANGDSKPLELGELLLRPGPSLSGWVRRQEDDLPIPGAMVVLQPIRSDLEGEALRTWRSSADERGFFQIYGLAPGTYRLEATADGRVPYVLDAVGLEEAAETLVGAIALTPPFRVTIQLDPPRHPAREEWTVALRPVRAQPDQRPVKVRVTEAGVAEAIGLRPAEYYLQVLSQDGESLLTETLRIAGDDWLMLEVPVVAVKGTVELGGEPLEATVRLETGAGDHAELSSDEDGQLSGWMRRPERAWLMATVEWSEAIWDRKRTVEVVPSIDDDMLEFEIEIPAGTLYGQVTDAEGKPRNDYPVYAWPVDGRSRSTEIRGETDVNGRFHLTGLESTAYSVQAGGSGLPASEVAFVDLAAGTPVREIRLVVWPTRRLGIEVTADGVPIAGANLSLNGIGRIPVSIDATTDGQGRATLDVPETVERAVMTVAAPSRLLWSGCLSVENEALSVALPTMPTGSLTLRMSGRNDLPPATDGQAVVLTGEGGFIGYQTLVNWNRLRDAPRALSNDDGWSIQTLDLPGVVPGSYAVTWSGAAPWELAARSCAGALPSVEWVTLPPGGDAELAFDVSAVQKHRQERLARDRGR